MKVPIIWILPWCSKEQTTAYEQSENCGSKIDYKFIHILYVDWLRLVHSYARRASGANSIMICESVTGHRCWMETDLMLK